jgi:hypothetical protein
MSNSEQVLHINDTDIDSGEVIDQGEVQESNAPMKQRAQAQPTSSPGVIDDTIDRRRLIQSIKNKYKAFPDRLSHVDMQSLETLSIDELDLLREDCRYSINTHGSSGHAELLYRMGMIGIENVACTFTPLKLEGYAMMVTQPHIMDLVKEIALDYEELIYVDPKIRLGQALLLSALTLHVNNSGKESTQVTTEISESLREKNKDL